MNWLGWLVSVVFVWLLYRDELKKRELAEYRLEQRIRELENALWIERDLRATPSAGSSGAVDSTP
jgi:hypothetical protein